VKDYLAPLERLPRISEFPTSGRLRVGPSSLRIRPPREHLVAIGLSGFESGGHVEGRPSHRALHWVVASRLERIDKNGHEGKLVRSKVQAVPTVKSFASSNFGFPGRNIKPSLYRLTVEIKNAGDKTLEKHQEYFRALPARSDLRLTTNFATLRPGERGFLRIDNYGTVRANYGFGYQLWNEQGEEVPSTLMFSNIALFLGPGEAGRCFSFEAPKDAPPGAYRIGAHAGDPVGGEESLLLASVLITT
jgi:hypothetical protein